MRIGRVIPIAALVTLAPVLSGYLWSPVHSGDPFTVGALFAALLMLSFLDVWLPRGDAADLSSAVAVMSLVLLDPLTTLVTVVAVRVAAHILRYRSTKVGLLLEAVTARSAGVIAGGAALFGVRSLLGSDMESVMLAVAAVALAYFVAEVLVVQALASLRLGRSFGHLLVGNLRLQGWLIAAQMSIAVLGVIIYSAMRMWGLLLCLVLLLVLRQSFVLLLDIREAYRATTTAIARSFEAHDPEKSGHAERVAHCARAVASRLGVHGRDLERLQYASLFHDIAAVAIDDPPPGADSAMLARATGRGAADVLADVRFLEDVMPLLRLSDGEIPLETVESGRDPLLAYIVCRSSDVDSAKRRTDTMSVDEGVPSPGAASSLVARLLDDRTRGEVERGLYLVCRDGKAW
ncbi:MAG: hypothetical protein WC971_00090 [Coriobacteriia bacterium]